MLERDLILDFIEWLENKKEIHLMYWDTNIPVTGATYPSDWTELENLIEEYSQDTDV